jgi:antitoxin component YwqK of YwqJK toxin-antitoxin module
MYASIYYSTSKFQKSKQVFQCGSYYSTIYAYVNSPDSAHLMPQSNNLHQSGSLKFNPKLDYELVFLRSDGFNRNTPDSMIIQISKLDKDAQLIIPFHKGTFKLKKMDFFQELDNNGIPNFRDPSIDIGKQRMKLDSTARYANGKIKAKYFIYAKNFPLYFVKEFDSINPSNYSQGFKLLTNYNIATSTVSLGNPIWTSSDNTKYNYWEYFENGKRIKHELWASALQEKYEWYPSGQLKSSLQSGQSNKPSKYICYLKNGSIKEEFQMQSQTQRAFYKTYAYAPNGNVVLINTYNSTNGITKQDLQKRETFYPSGQLKMEENFGSYYNIKYYNEDGTERIK